VTGPTHPIRERRAVKVLGVVQGVGFRPFVYRLAVEEQLAGWIGNDTDGVTLEIEGSEVAIEAFLRRLRAEAPPLARIDAVTVHGVQASGETGFRILASEVLGRVSTGIPADAATCADCLRELLDPADRLIALGLNRTDHGRNIGGGGRGPLRQTPHFIGNHRETAPGFARARRFDRRIKRQQITMFR